MRRRALESKDGRGGIDDIPHDPSVPFRGGVKHVYTLQEKPFPERKLKRGTILRVACIASSSGTILHHMVQYSRLDASFAALSDATRRGVLERLGRADASITTLAGIFGMTLTGMRKHVGVLEQAELVTTEKVGRVRVCRLGPRRLEEELAWIEQYRQLWSSRFDALEQIVRKLHQKEQVDDSSRK